MVHDTDNDHDAHAVLDSEDVLNSNSVIENDLGTARAIAINGVIAYFHVAYTLTI